LPIASIATASMMSNDIRTPTSSYIFLCCATSILSKVDGNILDTTKAMGCKGEREQQRCYSVSVEQGFCERRAQKFGVA